GSQTAADEAPKRPAAPATPAPGPAPAASPEDKAASKPSASPAQPAGAGWYCQVMGKEIGPLSPSALRELAASGFLAPGVPVREGIHGDWVSSERVKGLFAEAPKAAPDKPVKRPAASPAPAPKPAPVGPPNELPAKAPAKRPSSKPQSSGVSWYYEVLGEETGPLSTVQLRELAQSGFITPDVQVRKGADGRWLPAAQVEGLFDKADLAAAASLPPIPKPPPAPTAAPSPVAGRPRAADKPSNAPATARPQAADTGWYYEAMGQATGPVSSSALKELAGSGLLTPDTLVRRGSTGNWVAAKQVRGLFDRRAAAASKQTGRRTPAKPTPRPAPEPLPDSALEPLPSSPAAGPSPVGGMADLLDEAFSAPLPAAAGPTLRAPPVRKPARKPTRKPRHVASSSFGADLDRPRRGRAPGMASRILIGGFMAFIGGVGVVVGGIVILVFGLALVGAGRGGLSTLPAATAARGIFVLLVLLAMSVVSLVASYYYLSGGIGILQGKSAGADKGATASTIDITLSISAVLFQGVLAAMASSQGAEQAAAAGAAMGFTLVLASVRCVIAGALLWWCKTIGQNLPR
ncbi:MAG: DUF4339 domain-containing protein, partial [Planctomycetes bacterium]|nr:DUF4339 domain-containing protein [Planctomycetota bacterium]